MMKLVAISSELPPADFKLDTRGPTFLQTREHFLAYVAFRENWPFSSTGTRCVGPSKHGSRVSSFPHYKRAESNKDEWKEIDGKP